MSGETEASVSGWTVDTLHTHVVRQLDLLREEIRTRYEAEKRATDLAFSAQTTAMAAALASAEKAVEAALAAQKEAVTVAQVAAEKRADIQNEWRASLNDVLTRAMPRAEAEAAIDRVTEQIHGVAALVGGAATRAEIEAARQREAERFQELATRMTRAESHGAGAKDNRAGIYAAIAAGVALISVVVLLANFLSAK